MKKFLFLVMAATMLAGGAYAKHNCGCEGCGDCKVEQKLRNKQQYKGGFVAAETTPISVARLLRLPDDTKVMVIGHITSQIGDDTYNFTDGSDNVVVEIGKKDWKGQTVSPQDKVILKGKVSHEDGVSVLDVKSVKIAN